MTDISTFTKYALVVFGFIFLISMLTLYCYSIVNHTTVPDFVTSVLFAGVGAALNAIGVQHGTTLGGDNGGTK